MSDRTIIADRKRILAQAEALTSNPNATRADLKRADVLMAQAAEMRTAQEIIDHANDLAEEVGLPRRAAYKEPSQHAKEEAEIRHFLLTGESAPERRGLVITSGSKQEKRGKALNVTTGSQ